ncbi:hypothetical protein [Marinobacter salarius]|uniref:hypothetical protein n=1 Tax=Marinobacter salarius TaxID=1420917 RepID=UPI000F8792C5|nr:hypothetical protein [Marinobacter salarius]|tara:strand:- start:1160 stop:1471 length:312 start_codon:yes stop_codon:yes gene_type:complete
MAAVGLVIVGLIGLFVLKRLYSWMTSKEKSVQIVDVTEDIALASKVAATISSIFWFLLAPTGIFAFFVSPPLIVVIAPIVAAFAAGAYFIYALAKLYDKKRRK